MSWKASAFVKDQTHDHNGRKLTAVEKCLLYTLADYYNEEKQAAWPSMSRLAKESAVSQRHAVRMIKQLETGGVITVFRRGNNTSIYRFNKSKPQIEALGEFCWYCGRILSKGVKTQDHKTPVSKGGTDEPANLVDCCGTCNAEKAARTVEEYRELFAPGHQFWGERILDGTDMVSGVDGEGGDINPSQPAVAVSPEPIKAENPEKHTAPSLLPGMDNTDAVGRVFSHFIKVTERNPKIYTLTPARAQMGKARFKDCLEKTGGDPARAEKLMVLAVDTLAESDFHNARGEYKGRSTYNEWKHVFKSTDKLEEWLERSRR